MRNFYHFFNKSLVIDFLEAKMVQEKISRVVLDIHDGLIASDFGMPEVEDLLLVISQKLSENCSSVEEVWVVLLLLILGFGR